MPKKARDARGRALCRQTVRELDNDEKPKEERQAALLDVVNKAAANGDSDFGQLRAILSPVGERTNAYWSGTDAYVRTMARTGNHPRALRAACRNAGLLSPEEDLGPIDRLFNRIQARIDDRQRRSGNPSQRHRTPFTRRLSRKTEKGTVQ